MKKYLILLILVMGFVWLYATDFTYNGFFITRAALFNNIAPDGFSKTTNYIDSKICVEMTFSTSDILKAVWKVQMGSRNPKYIDYVEWGNSAEGGGIDTRGMNIQTVDAYLDYQCPMTKAEWKIGLQWWGDSHSLVWDDDFAAILGNRQITKDINLEIGYAKLIEGHDWDEDAPTDMDNDLYLLNLSTKVFKMQNLMRFTERDDAEGPHVNRFDLWLMPNFSIEFNPMTIDLTAAYNYSTEKSGITNNGWAISAKGTVNIKPKLGFDVLVTSGNDYSEEKTTTEFKVISEWYLNGLTIFGRGSSHEHANVSWKSFSASNEGQGIMSFVGTVEVPVSKMTTLIGAVGYLSAMTKKYIDDNGDIQETQGTQMGSEINITAKNKLTDELSFVLQGAYGMAGDYYKIEDEDLDNLYQLNGYIQYSF
jgi:hypothetical protein